MTSKEDVCGICNLRQISIPSEVWCIECDKGLCLECVEHHTLSKETHNHNTEPIAKYETLAKINQFCKEHNTKFEIYCRKHDHLCCSICVVSDHRECYDIIQLNMIQNVKKSYGFQRMELTINDMIENIQKIKYDRQANLTTLKEERKMIEMEIEQTRIKINAQLDNLQENIMKELHEAESKESKMISHFLDSIEKNEKEMKTYHENLINIKQHASDLQTFLAMKQMEQDVAEKDEYFTTIAKSNKLNRVSLSCKMNDALQNSFNEIRKLGEIIVSTHSSEDTTVRKKETQAQTVFVHVQSISIENLSFVLQSIVDTKLKDIHGCTLLPDGRMVFSSNTQHCVRGFYSKGSKDFDISLPSTPPIDITYIQANNTVAVSSGVQKCIIIIDVKNRKVKETIEIDFDIIDGIVSRNNTLIYCAKDRGIRMMNLTDKSIHIINKLEMNNNTYVDTFGDKLYYTNWYTDSVTCCDLNGETQWEFTDTNVLSCPKGISVDNYGNVYVVGNMSHDVVVISPDGQRHRKLLSVEDGLNMPTAVHFERTTNHLLVANRKEKAFLYKML